MLCSDITVLMPFDHCTPYQGTTTDAAGRDTSAGLSKGTALLDARFDELAMPTRRAGVRRVEKTDTSFDQFEHGQA